MKIGKFVNFFGKVKLEKCTTESELFFENRGKSETGGNASLPQGWTPLLLFAFKVLPHEHGRRPGAEFGGEDGKKISTTKFSNGHF